MFYIAHSGVKNMKWGVRRYQNYDGTLTPEGKARYSKYREDNREPTYKTKKQVREERKEFTNPNRYLRALKNPQHIEAMSDEDLKNASNRLNLENAYRKALSSKAAYIDKIAWEDKPWYEKIASAGAKAVSYKLSNIGSKYITSMADSLGGDINLGAWTESDGKKKNSNGKKKEDSSKKKDDSSKKKEDSPDSKDDDKEE